MTWIRRQLPDILIIALLLALPLAVFWPQTLGGRTLLPTENLYQYEPFATYREVVKAPAVPHNALLSDLVLENYQWKMFIRDSIAQGEIPLWNPHQFAGIPFMAAGQQSTLYPLSILYYTLPLTAAYGWFTVINLWLAGVFTYGFMRGLRVGRVGGLVSGVVYQLSAFMLISAVFPMIIGAAVWLPLLLLMTELIIRQQPVFGRPSSVPWVTVGAVALACNIFAGHVELTYYTLIITGYYAAARLIWAWWRGGRGSAVTMGMVRRGTWLVGMVVLGFGLGALQFIPLFELVSLNWRSGSASFQQVLGWAHPLRDVVQFIMPNFYGSPAHHSYFDVFAMRTVTEFTNAAGQPINTIDWGIKNYVEGALYLGILPLALSAYALVVPAASRHSRADHANAAAAMPKQEAPPYRGIFALLLAVSLTFMFGLPTYALIYILPGLNQSHTPFRWIYAVTLSIAVLAGFGLDALARRHRPDPSGALTGETSQQDMAGKWARRFGYAMTGLGAAILVALLLSRVFYDQVEPLMARVFNGMALADQAFSGARMFYSYQFTNALMFGMFTLGAGLVFWWAGRPSPGAVSHGRFAAAIPRWQIFAVGLVALDLMVASWGFNPASDPALLDFTPPVVEWLVAQEGDWRYTTLDDPTQPPLMNANVGWRYGLDDIRGYESIIPKQYVDFMQQLAPQVQLDFNRIAPLYTVYPGDYANFDYVDALQSPLLSMLNVRYVITHKTATLPDTLTTSPNLRIPAPWRLAYEDEAVRIWEHGYQPRAVVTWTPDGSIPQIDSDLMRGFDVVIEHDTGREKVLHVNLYSDVNSWLVVSETYMPGWRAFVRPRGGSDDVERPLPVELVQGNFQGVNLSPAVLEDTFRDLYPSLPEAQQTALDSRQVTARLVYSPASFQVGLFGTIISMALLVFMVGVWLWRLFVIAADENSTTVSRVARNSIAPIILNLFNRGIDFVFAFVMLRILGPEDAGIYYYAGIVFVWFDIFTNFGLDLFLIREASRSRDRAGYFFLNTTSLRVLLSFAGIPLVLGFLFIRQGTISPPLTSEALIAIGLLYIGLFPGSLSKGMTSLFYAFEKAEIPAAVATITTINKAVFGVIALVLGYGIIGLAAVSIINNFITFAVLLYTGRRLIRMGGQSIRAYRPDSRLMRGMAGESWPLMLNHFLATIFFQSDIVIIEAAHGAWMVGQYSVAYRWLLAINIIPAFFTQALLPVMSRQAHEDRAALKRAYGLAIKLLVSVALPMAVMFTFTAEALTGLLGGSEFLPDGAVALRLMIWSIPIGWINSLTQYVLVALDLQRRITVAFVIAVAFNVVTNLILVPQYGYQSAAITTIASELVLLVPFAVLLRGALGPIDWTGMLLRPMIATGGMLAVMIVAWPMQPILALGGAALAYVIVLWLLRPLTAGELDMLSPLIPARLRTLRMIRQLARSS